MKQQPTKQPKSPVKNKSGTALRYSFMVILLAYAIVPVATPIMDAFDANGPKFLALALLNLLAYSFLLPQRKLKIGEDFYGGLFRNRVGIVYVLFLVVVLLSFTKAINIYESVINFSKVFTIFSAAYIVSIVLRSDRRYIDFVAIVLSLLLLFDSFTVFYHTLQYIAGTVSSIYEIKSVYSNKNILGAALFVKIPFALWLMSFEKGWLKTLGTATLFSAFLATFIMSTRTFYVGTVFLTFAYAIYLGFRFFRTKEKYHLISLVPYFAALVGAFLVYNGTQKFLYPKGKTEHYDNVYNKDVFSRLSTIKEGEGGRTSAWKRSLKLVAENPALGVGIGNWKIAVLKYENPSSVDYTYMYKNHNDFIESGAETGILGGLLFLGIFVMIGANFLIAFLKPGATENSYDLLFFSAFGVFCYSFDAFFNFPADRPEIGALFAIFVGAGIAWSPPWSLRKSRQSSVVSQQSAVGSQQPEVGSRQPAVIFQVSSLVSYVFTVLMILFMLGSIYAFIQNYRSIILQRIVKGEMMSGKLTTSSEKFMTGFPLFPTVSLEGEPIAVHKARYLINEGKFDTAIQILKADKSSPYDTRQEFFISMAYYQMGKPDSSLVYSWKVFKYKPLFFNNTSNLCRTLQATGKLPEANGVMDAYLALNKGNPEAWLFAGAMNDQAGNTQKAAAIMDSAARYLPGDTNILKQQRMLFNKIKIKPYEQLYFTAMDQFNKKNYAEAVKYYTQFIEKEQGFPDAYDFRAFCYFFLKEHKKSIADIERVFAFGSQKPNLLNLRGVNYQALGDKEAACRDFEKAVKMGDKDAQNNYQKFCTPGVK